MEPSRSSRRVKDPVRDGALYRTTNQACFKSPTPRLHRFAVAAKPSSSTTDDDIRDVTDDTQIVLSSVDKEPKFDDMVKDMEIDTEPMDARPDLKEVDDPENEEGIELELRVGGSDGEDIVIHGDDEEENQAAPAAKDEEQERQGDGSDDRRPTGNTGGKLPGKADVDEEEDLVSSIANADNAASENVDSSEEEVAENNGGDGASEEDLTDGAETSGSGDGGNPPNKLRFKIRRQPRGKSCSLASIPLGDGTKKTSSLEGNGWRRGKSSRGSGRSANQAEARRPRKRAKKSLRCERCEDLHDGSFGSGRFCSRSCASRRAKRRVTASSASRKSTSNTRSPQSPRSAKPVNGSKPKSRTASGKTTSKESVSRKGRLQRVRKSALETVDARHVAYGRTKRGRMVRKPAHWWDLERYTENGKLEMLHQQEDVIGSPEQAIRRKYGMEDMRSPYATRQRTRPRRSAEKTTPRQEAQQLEQTNREVKQANESDEDSEGGIDEKIPRVRTRARRKGPRTEHGKAGKKTNSEPLIKDSKRQRGNTGKDGEVSTDTSSEKKDGPASDAEVKSAELHETMAEPSSEITGWDSEQVKLLLEAHATVTPGTTDFWKKVAAKLRSKTADQCAFKFYNLFPTSKGSSRRSTRPKISKKMDGEKAKLFQTLNLPKGRAPVKRMKAYRSVLQMADESHGADDFFDSTPHRSGRKARSKTSKGLQVFSPPDVKDTPGGNTTAPSTCEKNSPVNSYQTADHSKADLHVQKLKKTIRSQKYRNRRTTAKERRRAARRAKNGHGGEDEDEEESLPQRLRANIIHNEHQPLRNVLPGANHESESEKNSEDDIIFQSDSEDASAVGNILGNDN